MRVGRQFNVISDEYLDFLRNNYDNKVPMNNYDNNNKFFFGLLIKINNFKYYVPVSSFNTQQRTNMLIKNHNEENISSLRFCFMLPVPEYVNQTIFSLDLSEKTNDYINIVSIEEEFCLNNINNINNMALRVYRKVLQNNYNYAHNSCNFLKLEQGCKDWAFKNLHINLKNKYRHKNTIYITKEFNFQTILEINNGTFSRIENFDKNIKDLQNIKIYAKDEFGQEKYIEIVVKIKDGNVSSTIENKELVGSGAISE